MNDKIDLKNIYLFSLMVYPNSLAGIKIYCALPVQNDNIGFVINMIGIYQVLNASTEIRKHHGPV